MVVASVVPAQGFHPPVTWRVATLSRFHTLIAEIAMSVNASTENIGARRLYTVMEKLLEEISFNAPAMPGKELTIDAGYVHHRLAEITRDQDLSRYIL